MGEVRPVAESPQGLHTEGCWLAEPGYWLQNLVEDEVTSRSHPSGFPLPVFKPPASLLLPSNRPPEVHKPRTCMAGK